MDYLVNINWNKVTPCLVLLVLELVLECKCVSPWFHRYFGFPNFLMIVMLMVRCSFRMCVPGGGEQAPGAGSGLPGAGSAIGRSDALPCSSGWVAALSLIELEVDDCVKVMTDVTDHHASGTNLGHVHTSHVLLQFLKSISV